MIKSYPSIFVYLSMICLSISIILSSNNWFFTWMGFELSLFGFLPLFSMNASTTEATMKYYLMQSSGSAMFLVSFLLKSTGAYTLSVLGILMKLGLFPFFQWMPVVMLSLTWMGCLILTTIQKLLPLMVLMMLTNFKMVFLMSTTSILISSILGFNQTLMRPLMAYSSISHTSWIAMTTFFNVKMSIFYMFMYFTLTSALFISFSKSKTEKIHSLSIKNKQNLIQSVSLLILAGIPPFSIFLFKAYMLFMMMNTPLMIMILIISTYISTYYYLSFILPNLLMNKTNNISMTLMMLLINTAPVIITLS